MERGWLSFFFGTGENKTLPPEKESFRRERGQCFFISRTRYIIHPYGSWKKFEIYNFRTFSFIRGKIKKKKTKKDLFFFLFFLFFSVACAEKSENERKKVIMIWFCMLQHNFLGKR
jgi:hypothetical protein